MPVLVEDIMTRNVITATPEHSVMDTLKIARANRIRHVPIVEGNILKGVVSDRDLRDVSPSVLASMDLDLLEKTKVKDIMVTNVITVHPLDTVEDAARLLYENKIGCLPVVVEGNHLVGIVTDGDILFCFVEMMGVLERGSVIRVNIPDRPGTLAKVLEIISDHKVNIISIFMFPADEKKKGVREVILRLQTIDPSGIVKDIKELGYEIIWPEFWGERK
ncbi:MAG TPA: acetoin utilization protein AcuB [Peptococcaceae bacterium]|nr:MAG: Acetoin utilization protein, subunit b [Clostridia bacterium 41_269]HBT20346.1 acetoin utilization protein AcuB [Peptococcaceae bacterium]